VTLLDIKGLDEMAVDMTRLVMVILQGEDTKIEKAGMYNQHYKKWK
jgi:hypothetical protein